MVFPALTLPYLSAAPPTTQWPARLLSAVPTSGAWRQPKDLSANAAMMTSMTIGIILILLSLKMANVSPPFHQLTKLMVHEVKHWRIFNDTDKTVSNTLVPAGAKLAHFGLWEEIARDWENVVDSVKRSGRGFFIINWSCIICQITRTLTIKNQSVEYHNLHDFCLWERTKRSYNLKKSIRAAQIYDRESPVRSFDTLSEILWPLGLALSALKVKNCEDCNIRGFDFLNCETTSYLSDVTAKIYDRKGSAQIFDTIHDILWGLSVLRSLRKGRNAPSWRIGKRGVKKNFHDPSKVNGTCTIEAGECDGFGYEWTAALNSDNPYAGLGDFEFIHNFNSHEACANPTGIRATTTPGAGYSDWPVHIDLILGFWCVNSEQTSSSGYCSDWSIQWGWSIYISLNMKLFC